MFNSFISTHSAEQGGAFNWNLVNYCKVIFSPTLFGTVSSTLWETVPDGFRREAREEAVEVFPSRKKQNLVWCSQIGLKQMTTCMSCRSLTTVTFHFSFCTAHPLTSHFHYVVAYFIILRDNVCMQGELMRVPLSYYIHSVITLTTDWAIWLRNSQGSDHLVSLLNNCRERMCWYQWFPPQL